MRAWAAIDLKAGRVVQLVGGRPDREKISLADPVGIARGWVRQGFQALHVIDLDAALGTGDNRTAIAEILREVDVPVQVGGGLRDDDAVAAVLDAGAERAIVGTRAVRDRAWLDALVHRFPGRIVVAADVRGGMVVTNGWTADHDLSGESFLRTLADLPLAAVLVTDVTREGSLGGVEGRRFEALVASTSHPLIAAGGIAALDDLRTLERAGVAGAVLGMSLYTGAITAEMVAGEFAA